MSWLGFDAHSSILPFNTQDATPCGGERQRNGERLNGGIKACGAMRCNGKGSSRRSASRRWLLKRSENLTDKQRVKLRDLLRYNLRSVRAYRTFKMAELSLYHALGKLSELKLTHSLY